MNEEGDYYAYSYSGEEILQITEDGDGINAITKERGNDNAQVDILEVYA